MAARRAPVGTSLGQQTGQEHGADAAPELDDAAPFVEDDVVAHEHETGGPHGTRSPRQVRARQRTERAQRGGVAEHSLCVSRCHGRQSAKTSRVSWTKNVWSWPLLVSVELYDELGVPSGTRSSE